MRALSPNEKAEMQKRFRTNPAKDPVDVIDEAARVRQENNERQGQVQGCFQVRFIVILFFRKLFM